jgi:VIT1/CCC1 family predicted Fe2+/Mn2+ transporter
VGAGEDVVGSAGAAAGSSFVAFASGAVIPILPFFIGSGRTAIMTSAVLVGVALFATGATVGVLTGGPLVRRGLRQLAIGAGAAVVTYGLGRVFGATLG